MSEKPILYLNMLSPPSRAVLMAGAELDVDFDWRVVDLLGLEHQEANFVEVFVQFIYKFSLKFVREWSPKFEFNILMFLESI